MRITVAGLNHRRTPVAMRERLAFGQEGLAPALHALRKYVSEGLVLSTCNRTEVYALAGEAATGEEAIKRFLGHYHRVRMEEFEPYLYVYTDREAVGHLFAVACGLDSMILGEPQILGQVRQAYEEAGKAGSLGPVLSRLFRQALEVGKRARTETAIGRNAASASYAAVELAKKRLGGLAGRAVLLIGAGKMGQLTAKTLREKGAREILVTSRTRTRAQELAGRFGGRALDLSRLAEALLAADIVVSCTGSPHYLIRPELLKEVLPNRIGRPLLIVDMAVPRDVDPAVRGMAGVHLCDIDDLGEVVTANLEERRREAEKVQAIIESEVDEFMAWWSSRRAVPVIKALREWAEGIRQEEWARANGRLRGLSPAQLNAVNALTQAITNKMLHGLTLRMKEWAAAGETADQEVACRLLGLEPAGGKAPC